MMECCPKKLTLLDDCPYDRFYTYPEHTPDSGAEVRQPMASAATKTGPGNTQGRTGGRRARVDRRAGAGDY